MKRPERWLFAGAVFVVLSLWPADSTIGLLVLALAAFCIRVSRDLEGFETSGAESASRARSQHPPLRP